MDLSALAILALLLTPMWAAFGVLAICEALILLDRRVSTGSWRKTHDHD